MYDNDTNPQMADFWLKLAVAVAFFLAAVSVLSSFLNLTFYAAAVSGNVDESGDPAMRMALEEIRKSPYPFLLVNLYNMVLWNAVLVVSIWLLRYHEWARTALKALLGFDIVFTVSHLTWMALSGEGEVADPSWFVFLNVMQVSAILVLSHPLVAGWIASRSTRRVRTRTWREDRNPRG